MLHEICGRGPTPTGNQPPEAFFLRFATFFLVATFTGARLLRCVPSGMGVPREA
jgi:hypothetical protein